MIQLAVTALEEGAKLDYNERQLGEGISEISIHIDYETPRIPQKVTVQWRFPCTNIYSIFSPCSTYDRNNGPEWHMKNTWSRLAERAPLHQLVSSDGFNTYCIALSDAKTPCNISAGVVEAPDEERVDVSFFTQQVNTISSYDVRIYIDQRKVRYEEAVKDVVKYWEEKCGYPGAYIPKAALDSVYSTWYSYHQAITADDVIKECKIAKNIGMDTVIVDDGWQIDRLGTGYYYCGDWKPAINKFPDMKACVDEVHKLGMKFVLWYSLSAIGVGSEAYKKYKDMLLSPNAKEWSAFDPRFPEIRKHMIGIYVKAAKEWGLDGFKLDFIDSFAIHSDTPSFDERWDTTSLEEGVDILMTELISALREINPEIMIEFRQFYFGPVIKKFGNMIRVGDCPHDSIRNHVAGTDLRLMLGNTPVHSDMLMWHNLESKETAARQVISTLFLVPQISVRLEEIPKDHFEMLKFYLKFRNEHRETLINGFFEADNPENLYSQIRAKQNGELIAVCASKNVLTCNNQDKTIYFINGGADDKLYIKANENMGKKQIIVYTCDGEVVKSESLEFNKGIYEFDVPRSGMIEIK